MPKDTRSATFIMYVGRGWCTLTSGTEWQWSARFEILVSPECGWVPDGRHSSNNSKVEVRKEKGEEEREEEAAREAECTNGPQGGGAAALEEADAIIT